MRRPLWQRLLGLYLIGILCFLLWVTARDAMRGNPDAWMGLPPAAFVAGLLVLFWHPALAHLWRDGSQPEHHGLEVEPLEEGLVLLRRGGAQAIALEESWHSRVPWVLGPGESVAEAAVVCARDPVASALRLVRESPDVARDTFELLRGTLHPVFHAHAEFWSRWMQEVPGPSRFDAAELLDEPDWATIVQDRGERPDLRARAFEAWEAEAAASARQAFRVALAREPDLAAAIASRLEPRAQMLRPPLDFEAPEESAALVAWLWLQGAPQEGAQGAVLKALARPGGVHGEAWLERLVSSTEPEIAAAARSSLERARQEGRGRLSIATLGGELAESDG